MSGWGKKLAKIWTNNVQPSRPSNAELVTYTNLLREVQGKIGSRKAEMLILGSTPEFRDWGYEQNLNITVVDKSKEYYDVISGEIRHKNIVETLCISRWEDMSFDKKFDFIIGDLAIGNVEVGRFDDFLECIHDALYDEGLFVGKSFIWDSSREVKSPQKIAEYFKNRSHLHPYNIFNHLLGLYCLNKDTMEIDFAKMYQEMLNLRRNGIIDDGTMAFFQDIGWNTEMKFTFFAPSQDYFISRVNEHLKFIRFEHTEEEYTFEFPIYVIGR